MSRKTRLIVAVLSLAVTGTGALYALPAGAQETNCQPKCWKDPFTGRIICEYPCP